MFTGITREICEQAWGLIEPALNHGADLGIVNGYKGSLVVLDPIAGDGSIFFTAHPGGEVHQETLGFATAKAAVAFRTGRDTSTLRTHYPHLYTAGDIVYPGGVVRDGMVVAYSGVQGEIDEMVAEWFVSAVRALARLAFVAPDGGDSQPTPYLGREAG
jgi:hypothetical protein